MTRFIPIGSYVSLALLTACGSGTGGGDPASGRPELYEHLVNCGVLTPGYFDGDVAAPDLYADCYAGCLVALDCDKLSEAMCNVQSEPSKECRRQCDPPFACANGTEVLKRQQCDGIFDCSDQSDELGCESVTPPDGAFLCSQAPGFWIIEKAVCNGVQDCPGNTDEQNCTYFQCADGSNVSLDAPCDGLPDCSDASDEANCPEAEPFLCSNGYLITTNEICNGFPDCGYGEDELMNCPDQKEFTCSDGRVVPFAFRCNDDKECDDGSDEEGCSHFVCPSMNMN